LQNENNEVGLYHQGPVYDISWALLNGRSYDLLASCGKDGVFFLLYSRSKSGNSSMKIVNSISKKWKYLKMSPTNKSPKYGELVGIS